ncbi:MAG TPA: WD40 repeat domain-containing protein [Acidimicrobiales bacterium]
MRTVTLPRSPFGHSAPITHVAIAPEGDLLATSSYDGTAMIWQLSGGGNLAPLGRILHRRLVNAASWSPQHHGILATASADKTVGLHHFDRSSGLIEPIGRLARHTDDVNSVAWLADGERLVTASEDSTALLWEWRTGRFLGRVTAHSGHCMAIAASVTGSVLSVGEDGEVFAGNVDLPQRAYRRSFATSIEGCSWSADGSRAALACDDGVVRIVSPELDLLAEYAVASSAARSVVFADDGSDRLIVGSYDAAVRVLRGDVVESAIVGGRLWPRALDVSGRLVVVGSFSSAPVVLEIDSLVVVSDGGPATSGPNALAVAGNMIAVGLDSGLVVTVPRSDLTTGTLTGSRAWHLGDDPVLSLAAVDGGWLAGSYGGLVSRFATDGPDGVVINQLSLDAPVTALAGHSSGRLALAGTYGGEIARLAVGDGLSVAGVGKVHDGSVKSLAWRLDTEAVSAATDCTVRLLSMDGSSEVLWNHGNLINAVATDQRGLIASASRDRLVRVGGRFDRPIDLLGADESMKAVGILGEGQTALVLGGSYDFAVYAWQIDLDGVRPDARSGDVVFEADQAISTILRLDASAALVASWDGTLTMLTWTGSAVVAGASLHIADLLAAAAVERPKSQVG